jgi:hypothetical protein
MLLADIVTFLGYKERLDQAWMIIEYTTVICGRQVGSICQKADAVGYMSTS